MKRRHLAIVSVTLILAACGSDGESDTASSDNGSTAREEATTASTGQEELTTPTSASETSAAPATSESETSVVPTSSESDSTTTDTATPTSGPAPDELYERPVGIPPWPELSEAPPEGIQVVYVNTGTEATAQVERGIVEATEVLGWEYRSLPYSAADPSTANSAYLTAINEGADVIVAGGLPAAAVEEGLAAAEAGGVHVVHLFSVDPPDQPGFDQVFNLSVSFPLWAEASIAAIMADAEAQGQTPNIGVLTSSGIPFVQAGADGMIEAAGRMCPDCSIDVIDVPAADLTSGQAPQSAVSFMQRNPDVNYVHVNIGVFAGGMRAALDAAGFEDVRLGGLTPTAAQNEAIEQGEWAYWVQGPVEYTGWVAMDSAARALTGGDAGLHNEEPPPIWVVTADNLDFDASELPDFPDGYREELIRLWQSS